LKLVDPGNAQDADCGSLDRGLTPSAR